jgi:hypothetical protein
MADHDETTKLRVQEIVDNLTAEEHKILTQIVSLEYEKINLTRITFYPEMIKIIEETIR